jgi:ATP-binding cassette, subfamily B, bacterial PglK
MMGKYQMYLEEVIYLTGEYKYRLPFLVLLFLALSILDLMGIGLIMPYVSLITTPDIFFGNAYLVEIISNNPMFKDKNMIIYIISAVIVLLFTIKTYFSIFINRKILEFSYYRGAQLRTMLMNNYQSMPYEKYVQNNSASYIYNIQTLTMMYSKGTLQSFLRLISELIVTIVITALLLYSDAAVLLTLIFLLLISYLLYSYLFKDRLTLIGQIVNKLNTEIIKFINEGMSGLKEIRILGKEEHFCKKIADRSKEYANISVENHVIQTIPRYSIELILMLFVVLVVVVQIHAEGDVTGLLPVLSMFGVAAIRLTPSINQIIASTTQMRYGRNALHLLYKDVLVYDKGDLSIHNSICDDNNIIKGNEFCSLELQNVSYNYNNSSIPAINNINLKISKGECIGIVGTSGSGKSTLIDIILGLLSPSEGVILYNKLPFEEKISSFQQKAAYLPQEVFIIDDSLRKNITFEENNNANLPKVSEAIKKAKIYNEIISKNSGLEERLGEDGVLLSGGQRQRVSLARAFYHDKDFLVMDESTSALDEKTEEEICYEIQQLKGEKTIIIVTHKKTVLGICDYVYDLDEKAV